MSKREGREKMASTTCMSFVINVPLTCELPVVFKLLPVVNILIFASGIMTTGSAYIHTIGSD